MLNEQSIRQLLHRIAQHECSIDAAIASLCQLPFEDLEHSKIDHHRALRRGFPEVIYCQGKTPQQIADIAKAMAAKSPRILGTRATPDHYNAALSLVPDLQYDPLSRTLWLDIEPDRARKPGVLIAAAGTSDLPAAEEAARTLDLMGHSAEKIVDVGVAGLHRLLHHLPALRKANVIIVAAGMEGALPSVVAGLVDCPVIGLPTSVGYGASFGGLAALLAMLNSCASGLCVVNIDNGFGAAHMAALINDRIPPR